MNGRTSLITALATASLLALVPAGISYDLVRVAADNITDDELAFVDPIAEALCADLPEEAEPVHERIHEMPWPTVDHPDMILTTHAACLADFLPVDTDCTATNYSLTGWKWNSAYNAKLDTANPYGFSSSTLLSFWNAGGNTWDNAVAADIYGSTTAGGSAGAVRQLDGVNQHGFKKGGNYVAVTYTWSSGGNAVESDAAYNTQYAFGVNGESNKIDLGHTQTHEIGHTFGMGHTTTASVNNCQTMYPYVSYGYTGGRTLADGDLLGIEAIY